MSSYRQPRGVRRCGIALSVLGVALCPVLAFGQADMISAGSVGEGPIFHASDPELDVDADIWGGGVTFNSDPFAKLYIAPPSGGKAGRVEWSAILEEDLNPGGPLAQGLFYSGGTLRMSGDVYDRFYNHLNPEPEDWVILEANWVSAFELEEEDDSPNKLVSKFTGDRTCVVVHVSGGWLYENGYVGEWYGLTYNGLNCRQDGADLTDFQCDIISTSSSSMLTLALIPEPSAALLVLGVFGLFVARRKR